MTKIPHIIHQTWKSRNLSKEYQKYADSWKKFHPTWDYRFYDDAACLRLVQTHFPQFLSKYIQLPTPVMKADMFRYLVIYQYGGVYVDIDAEALKSLDDLLIGDDDMIVGVEIDFNNLTFAKFNPIYKSYYKKHGIDKQYVQYIFMATPKNPILYEIIENIHTKPTFNNAHLDTFMQTGPALFSKIIHKHRQKVKVLNVNAFNGVTSILKRYILGINTPLKESYLKHHEASSWKNKDDIIYTILCCVVLALFITILVLFSYSIMYFNKCKGIVTKKCIPLITYCKIKKIMMIIGILLVILILSILINFAVKDRAYWPI